MWFSNIVSISALQWLLTGWCWTPPNPPLPLAQGSLHCSVCLSKQKGRTGQGCLVKENSDAPRHCLSLSEEKHRDLNSSGFSNPDLCFWLSECALESLYTVLELSASFPLPAPVLERCSAVGHSSAAAGWGCSCQGSFNLSPVWMMYWQSLSNVAF